jgi:hypothetical protein
VYGGDASLWRSWFNVGCCGFCSSSSYCVAGTIGDCGCEAGGGLLVLLLVEKPLKGFMSIAKLRGRDREDGREAEGVYSWPRKEEIAPWVGDLGGAVAQTFGAVQAWVAEGRLS